MRLPSNTQNLVNQYLQELLREPEHKLSAVQRLNIYKSFYPESRFIEPFDFVKGMTLSKPGYSAFIEREASNINRSDYVLGWLAILTAKQVLPVWKKFWKAAPYQKEPSITPHTIIEISEGLLTHEISAEEANDKLNNDFNGGCNILSSVTFEVGSAYLTAYFGLEAIVANMANFKVFFPIVNTFVRNAQITSDFAYNAANAFAAKDHNVPGYWDASLDLVEFDVQKRLIFWKWWLTEALPQAWELSQQFSL
jgi:hypothetical protein